MFVKKTKYIYFKLILLQNLIQPIMKSFIGLNSDKYLANHLNFVKRKPNMAGWFPCLSVSIQATLLIHNICTTQPTPSLTVLTFGQKLRRNLSN